MIDAELPLNLEAERFVLGSVMLNSELMTDVRNVLAADDWAIEKHGRIWRRMCDLYDRGVSPDRVTLAEELNRLKELESVDGLSYLCSLDDGLPRVVNLEGYVRIVKDKSFLRRVIMASDALATRAATEMDTPAEIAQYASRLLVGLAEPEGSRGFVTASEILAEHGISALLNPRRDHGIPLPWPWMDHWLAGLRPEQLVILGARTSVGKTSAALQIAVHAARKGVRVAIFSLEMSKESLMQRMIAQASGTDPKYADTLEDRNRQTEAACELAELPLFIDDSASQNTAMIHAALRKFSTKNGAPGMVIVDHLHILRGVGRLESRTLEVAENARTLKLMAKEFRCPFVVPAQLNRAGARENDEPDLSDLRQSGEIEEHADVVIFLHIRKHEPGLMTRPGIFKIAKQREGARDIHCEVVFLAPTQRFMEAESGYNAA